MTEKSTGENAPRPVRRVITGHDGRGHAVVISDGPAPFVHKTDANIGWSSTDIWRTDATPAPVAAEAAEPTLGPRRQLPNPHGTVLRVNTFPPESQTIRNMDTEAARRMFASLGNETAATFGKGGRHPMMHRTETIDYAIVLEGEIVMILDDEDVILRAGDIAIQCGTNHAWSNRSDKPCRVAFILIDGKFDAALAGLLQNADAH